MALWINFNKCYLETSDACNDVTVTDLEEKQRRCVLSKQFIELVELGQQTRKLNKKKSLIMLSANHLIS